LIAANLGLYQNEIDKLKRENPTSRGTVVHNILLAWKRIVGPDATLEKLEEALKDAERDTGASVDWVVFSEAKERILAGRK
jgi:hypothetical protein